MSSITQLSYWFNQKTKDNNGNTVTDINAGLRKLIPDLWPIISTADAATNQFIIDETLAGQPDYMASVYNDSPDLFWYICLSNLVTSPFDDFDTEHIYYAYSTNHLNEIATNKNSGGGTQPASSPDKNGKIITLN